MKLLAALLFTSICKFATSVDFTLYNKNFNTGLKLQGDVRNYFK